MSRRAIVVVDLGYGDSGKGTMVDALVRATGAHTVVRFNGGPQALHHVETDDGRTHGFSQFGAGTFAGARTYLSRDVLVSPTHLLAETKSLAALGVTDAIRRLAIDPEALIITPYHRAANWIRELARGDAQHGTCGMGIGEVMNDMALDRDLLCAGDLLDARKTAMKVRRVREEKREELLATAAALAETEEAALTAWEILEYEDAMVRFLENCKTAANLGLVARYDSLHDLLTSSDGTIVFEGAQGVLLDERHGFHPHTTWSTTTCENAMSLLGKHAYAVCGGEVRRLGVLRAYSTRHGAGPMVTYDEEMTAALPEPHNRTDGWQGNFRCGPFDLVTTRYALEVAGQLDGLAITCLDRVAHLDAIKVCVAYRYEGTAGREELEPFFRFENEKIVGIRPHWPRELGRQAKLTEHLKRCRPELTTVKQRDFLGFVERELEIPILATSRGPRASDKSGAVFDDLRRDR